MVMIRACYSHADLKFAFDLYAEMHSAAAAAEALERATGTRDVAAVPERKVVFGLGALMCGPSVVGKAAPPEDRLAKVHAALASIGEKAFAARRGAPAE
jgi:ABC-type enterochelin transport system substrate-binding protein